MFTLPVQKKIKKVQLQFWSCYHLVLDHKTWRWLTLKLGEDTDSKKDVPLEKNDFLQGAQ